MSETGLVLQLFLLSAIVLSSVSWHILIKGIGNVDNLWTFFLIITMVFLLTSSIISYFPFITNHFFLTIVIFSNIASLYIYSFPRSRWPHFGWIAIIGAIDTASGIPLPEISGIKRILLFFSRHRIANSQPHHCHQKG